MYYKIAVFLSTLHVRFKDLNLYRDGPIGTFKFNKTVLQKFLIKLQV